MTIRLRDVLLSALAQNSLVSYAVFVPWLLVLKVTHAASPG